MRKFKDGDKVMFIEEQHSQDYIRTYIPLIGTTGVIQSFSEVYNEYMVLFENANDITFCYEGELEAVKPKEYDLYVKGELKNMENKVLELWYERKSDAISKEYEEKEIEFNNSKELVIKYKEILERFGNELEELYKSGENQEQNYIINTMTNNVYEYNINYKKLRDELGEKYIRERNKKLRDLDELKKEIEALLSLSDDLEYQVEVLTRYGVLDKKTKKMVD